MRKTVFVAIALAMQACSIQELGGDGKSDSLPPVWNNPSSGNMSESVHTVVYCTGFEYPSGYDWKSDPEKGSVKCSLVVYADKVPMMKVPVGDSYLVSSDPDMHRIIEGHLYTDFPISGETVIKKDGVELFRYAGEESLCTMIVKDDDIYTLGNSRSGMGFALRKNGEIVVGRDDGHVFERLQEWGDSLCFAFIEPITTQEATIERYYHVVDGKVSQVAVRDDVRKVWDVMVHDGQVCCLATLTGVSDPVVMVGNALYTIGVPSLCRILDMRLFSAGDKLCVEGMILVMGVAPMSLIWSEFKVMHTFQLAAIQSVITDDDGICCLSLPMADNQVSQIYKGGEVYDLPRDYVPMGNVPMTVADGIIYSALSSTIGGKPVLWKEGHLDTLDINGFLSSVSACKTSVR